MTDYKKISENLLVFGLFMYVVFSPINISAQATGVCIAIINDEYADLRSAVDILIFCTIALQILRVQKVLNPVQKALAVLLQLKYP